MPSIRGNSLMSWVIPVILFVLVLISGSGFAQQQQPLIAGQFRLSQEVRWENSVLPMGEYLYFVDSSRWPAVVRVQQKDGAFSGIFIPQVLLRPGHADKSGIILGKIGEQAYVKALYLHDGAGEFSFSTPLAETDAQNAEQPHAQKSSESLARAAEYVTIFNPKHDRISIEEIEKVYLSVCEAVEKEYKRPAAIRPHLILRLGSDNNVLRYPMREIQLKKWDQYRFADAVVEIALQDMVSPEDRVRLSNTAVNAAGATVNVCELKACVNQGDELRGH